MAAVGQLSYLVLKCFSATFATDRELVPHETLERGNDVSRFVNYRRKSRFVPGHSGFNILQPSTYLQSSSSSSASSSSSSKGMVKCTWPQVCTEISDILRETVPIIKEKLTENNDEHFMINVKSLISEALVLIIYYFFARSLVKSVKPSSNESNMMSAIGSMLNKSSKVKLGKTIATWVVCNNILCMYYFDNVVLHIFVFFAFWVLFV
jgi:hypothetical protein